MTGEVYFGMKKWIKHTVITASFLTWLTETAFVIITTPTFRDIFITALFMSARQHVNTCYTHADPEEGRSATRCFHWSLQPISLLNLIWQTGAHLTLINTAFAILCQRSFKLSRGYFGIIYESWYFSHFETLLFLRLAAKRKRGNNLKEDKNIKTRKFSFHSSETH